MCVLAIDIGGSKLIAGYVNARGQVLTSVSRAWNALAEEAILAEILGAAGQLRQENPQVSPQAVGVTIPGLADPGRGLWVEASFSGIRNFPIARHLEDALGLPVYIENDVRACALAEHRWGCCQGVRDFAWITVSNGIGSAIFVDGKLYRGHSGNAGEVGHVVVEEDSRRGCGCGHTGCAESHASGRGLRKNYLELSGRDADAQTIAQLARQGDGAALRTYEMEGEYLGRIAGLYANLLNPGKIVFGGGVMLSRDLFWDTLLKTAKSHTYLNANPELAIETTALGYHAALLGAAALAMIG